jgi:DNA-binding NarL/FixJ family response regulator
MNERAVVVAHADAGGRRYLGSLAFRSGLRAVPVGDEATFFRALAGEKPMIVLLDQGFARLRTLRLVRFVKETLRHPTAVVVRGSAGGRGREEREEEQEARAAGAAAYVPRSAPPDRLVETLRGLADHLASPRPAVAAA